MALLIFFSSLAHCTSADSFFPTYFLRPRVRHIPDGGRAFLFFPPLNLGSIGHWRFESTLARLDWHNPQDAGGKSGFSFLFGCMSVRYVLSEPCCLIPDGRGREGLGILVIENGSD